jgi:hypothetical protein
MNIETKRILARPISSAGLPNMNNDHLLYTPGLWIDGRMRWFKNGDEKLIFEEEVTVNSKKVHVHSKVYFYSLYISNHSQNEKNVKVVTMHQHPNAERDHLAFVSPSENVIFHLTNNKVFLVNGNCDGDGLKQYTIQPPWSIYSDQIWSNLQKGSLKYQPLNKGGAISLFSIDMNIPPKTTGKANTWIITGESKNELIKLDQLLLKNRLAFPFKK